MGQSEEPQDPEKLLASFRDLPWPMKLVVGTTVAAAGGIVLYATAYFGYRLASRVTLDHIIKAVLLSFILSMFGVVARVAHRHNFGMTTTLLVILMAIAVVSYLLVWIVGGTLR